MLPPIEPEDAIIADADFTDEDVFAAVTTSDPSLNLPQVSYYETHDLTREMIKFHEGTRHTVGLDEGNLNAGFGHTLDHNDKYVLNDSIPPIIQEQWLDSDFNDSTIDLRKIFSDYDTYNVDRQAGLVDVAFHAGYGTLTNQFDGFIEKVKLGDWEGAALELQYIEVDDSTHVDYMKESDYYKDYPLRSRHVIGLIKGTMTVQYVLDEYK